VWVFAISRAAPAATCCSPWIRMRLRGFAGQQMLVLDLGHGVHGMDQRNAPVLLERQADAAGEPVVRVDHVVTAALLRHEAAQLAVQLRQPGGQFLLGHFVRRRAGQMDQAGAGARVLHR